MPALFRWLSKKYPKIVSRVVEDTPTKVTNDEGEVVEVPIRYEGKNPNGFEVDNLYRKSCIACRAARYDLASDGGGRRRRSIAQRTRGVTLDSASGARILEHEEYRSLLERVALVVCKYIIADRLSRYERYRSSVYPP